MIVVGVDNASNRTGVCTGWVSGPNGERFRAHRVAIFSRLAGETAWAFGARIGEAIEPDVRAIEPDVRAMDRRALLLIEEPPSQVRDDVRHGPQALIGWRLGLTAGATAAVVEERLRGTEVRLCPVSTWRNAMRQWAAARGIPCDPTAVVPTSNPNERIENVERTELGYLIHRSCGHDDELIGSDITRAPARCPKCGKGPKGMSRSELVTDGWKRVAVDMARRVAEAEIDEIIAAARKRARRNQDGPAHRLEGVSDAAEAVCIAAWGPR